MSEIFGSTTTTPMNPDAFSGGGVEIDQTYNPESENAQSGKAVAEAVSGVSGGSGGNFVELFSTEITQEAFDSAGESGIKVVTVGDDSKTFEPYSEILVCLYVPKNEDLNTEAGKLRCYLTKTEEYSTSSTGELLKTQSISISTACGISVTNASRFTIRAVFADDTFLYGEVIKNGYGDANGYAGDANGWTSISKSFKKNDKKYVHIDGGGNKFPVGTTVTVFGRQEK